MTKTTGLATKVMVGMSGTALALAASVLVAPAASAATGGLNLNQACRWQWRAPQAVARVGSSTNAYSWYCSPGQYNPERIGGIDMARACRDQYSPQWKVGLRSARDPYSWYCYR